MTKPFPNDRMTDEFSFVIRHYLVIGRCGLIILLLAICYLPAAVCHAQDRPTDYQIKAKFLEKFGKFILWPDAVFAQTNTPLCIGIFQASDTGLQTSDFRAELETLAAHDTINGHPVQILTVKALPDLRCCQILYIPAALKAQERDILDAIKSQNLPILTVGDADDFCAAGGMIQFIIEDQQVHFEIKNDAARAAGLKISSKLLTLAKRAGQ